MMTHEGLEAPELDALIDRLDRRYVLFPASEPDRDVDLALKHIEATRNAVGAAREVAEQMRQTAALDDSVSDESAKLLVKFSDELLEKLNDN